MGRFFLFGITADGNLKAYSITFEDFDYTTGDTSIAYSASTLEDIKIKNETINNVTLIIDAINKVDGFPMQGQPIGKTLQVDVNGTIISVVNFDVTARTIHNLAWIQGSMNFPYNIDGEVDPSIVFSENTTPHDQFNSDSSWDDVKVKKVTLHFSSCMVSTGLRKLKLNLPNLYG